jgi:hypothetical protein
MMTKEVLPNILKKKRRKRALWYDTEGLYIYFFTKTLQILIIRYCFNIEKSSDLIQCFLLSYPLKNSEADQ